MKNSILIIFSIIAFSFCLSNCKSNITPKIHSENNNLTTKVDSIAMETFQKESFPGMAIMIWQDGKIIFSKGYGYANVENKVPIDPLESEFRIGSISKPYTAAALGILYDRDKIFLDFPIQMYVEEFPKKKYEITLRNLTGHLAGIRHYQGNEFMSNKYYATVDEGLDIFENDPLLHAPGSKYAYSSYGWNLVSAAIEEAADKDFLSFMETEVFERLDMEDSGPDYAKEENPTRVSFYQKNAAQEVVLGPQVDNSYKWAGGGFTSSAEDVVKFAVAHIDGKILSEETFKLWTKSQQTTAGEKTNYGIGWRTRKDDAGRQVIGHSGGSVGGTSMMLVYPEERLVVVTLVNMSSARMGNLAGRIAEEIL